MQKEDKERIKLTTKEILMYLIDGYAYIEEIFNPKSRYDFSKSYNDYCQARSIDKQNFSRKIYRLNRQKYIRSYLKDKNRYFELTKKGKEKIKSYKLDEIEIKKSKKWDKKWRLVIFDIPENRKIIRNLLLKILRRLNFTQLQKSVYVYPFECYREISQIRSIINAKKYIQYIVADRVETEINLIEKFYNNKVLNNRK